MIPRTCVAIETKKFPILDGEDDELVNEGMYGKALCLYLEKELPLVGIEVPFFCCEDWGWWIEVKDDDFSLGLCVYSDPGTEKYPKKYAVISSVTNEKKWSWEKFKKIEMSHGVLKIMDAIEKVCREDKEIENVSRHDAFPF